MPIRLLIIELRAEWCHSLKEKRAILQSLRQRLSAKFNISLIESGLQDVHTKIELSIVYIAANNALADQIQESVLQFIRTNSPADVTTITSEAL